MRIGILGLGLLLASCQNPTIISQKAYVPNLSTDLFTQCKAIKIRWPKSATLTDKQVASVLNSLKYKTDVCENSIDAIHEALIQARVITESQ